MSIQIFGTAKNFDVKKTERWFSERHIAFQRIDLKEKGISKGELDSVIVVFARQCGSRAAAVEMLADPKSPDYALFAYLDDSEREEKLIENSLLLAQPIVRNGKNDATVGYCPEMWKKWLGK